ncbi:Protein SrpB [Thermoflexales bacterium]|nr:Protein SrpB [Thermoflexales bacterium]
MGVVMLNEPNVAQQLELILKVALAMLLGGILGLEREKQERPAGLRTHMLMAGAAALLVTLGTLLVEHFNQEVENNLLRVDPIRVIEAVIVGVSFLGAGTIMRNVEQNRIEGLTTAATLLFVAAIGITVAAGQLVLALGATALALITLRGIARLEHRL